ncbi:MAG TPA: CPBP family intramembrane glutamic endopeptidase [Acidobacteriaceae bacterium]
MSDDPESISDQPIPGESEPAVGAEPQPETPPEPLTSTAQFLAWPAPQEPLAHMLAAEPVQQEPVPFVPPPAKLIPHIGHFGVFLLLGLFSLFVAAIGTVLALRIAMPHQAATKLISGMTQNILVAMSMQAVWYVVLWGLSALVFGVWWKSIAGIGFLQGIHWNSATAKRWFLLFAITGLVTGLVITIAGNFVPMPKAPPILEDLTKSRLGAWMLMVFGITLAPLTEELAFRGFLLPGLVNIFRWLERKRAISEEAVRYVGIPLSIVLTSIPFALMHSAQVSNSWGPVLLIGCVSIVLCVVRLRTSSVASGIIVHAFYNLTLFSGLLIQTDGFRHLDKLKG